MSRTYRRTNKTQKNRKNLNSVYYHTDLDIILSHDNCFLYRWTNLNSSSDNVKEALAFFHSDANKPSFNKKLKKIYKKTFHKELRRDGKKTLSKYILQDDKLNFDDIIEHKPKNILWRLH